MKYTIPTLVFQLFKYIYRLDKALSAEYDNQNGVDMQKLFYQINELLAMIQSAHPEVCLRLYLQTAQVINNIEHNENLDELSYDFVSTALIVYQDELADTNEKLAAIKLITATISHLDHFDPESYDSLSTNASQYCHKLLKKSDQCEAITASIHMFANPKYPNDDQFDKCCARNLKIAAGCMMHPGNLYILVGILNKYVYFFARQHERISAFEINKLIDLIKEHISTIKGEGKFQEASNAVEYFDRTLEAVKMKQDTQGSSERFQQITV